SLTASNGSFNFNGGTLTGQSVVLVNSALALGSMSTGTGSFLVRGGSSTLSGNVASSQSIAIQGSDAVGDATLTAAAGFTNAGQITLQDIDHNNHDANRTVTPGILTNTGTLTVGGSNGGGSRRINANLSNSHIVALNEPAIFNRAGDTFSNDGTFTVAAGQALTL